MHINIDSQVVISTHLHIIKSLSSGSQWFFCSIQTTVIFGDQDISNNVILAIEQTNKIIFNILAIYNVKHVVNHAVLVV